MVNYQNGQIYMIKCNTKNLVYIGSTAQEKLSVRIGGHKRAYRRYCNGKTNYCNSYKIFENDNYDYETLEFYRCDTRRQLEERERFYIEDYKNKYGDKVVNKHIPTRTYKEWCETNKEELAKYHKEWYNNNIEELLAKQKVRYQNNREDIKKKQSERYHANKEDINKKRRERYHAKKQSINS